MRGKSKGRVARGATKSSSCIDPSIFLAFARKIDQARTIKTLRGKAASIGVSRWTAYASAGAATALTGAHPAQAAIHYSGRVDIDLDPSRGQTAQASLQLDQPADVIRPWCQRWSSSTSGGDARFFVGAIGGASVVGHLDSRGGGASRNYVSKLRLGQHISLGHFVPNDPYNQLAYLVGYSHSEWTEKGQGFVGFRFNDGTGIRYGWARLYMTGAKKNSYRLIDYAYGDVGEPVKAGQKRSGVDGLESLGGLALGAVGLSLWRRRRLPQAA